MKVMVYHQIEFRYEEFHEKKQPLKNVVLILRL